VAHGELMTDISAEDRGSASVDAAFAGQNVYLYCASEGLATVLAGPRLQPASRAGGQGQFVTFAQTVGYPALA
jgi:nitroreductase